MKYLCLALIVCLALVSSQYNPEPERKDGVLILTQNSFKPTLDKYENVLVMFYAPWCGHCKKLHPEYEAAAQQLLEEGSEIQMGNVDATEETELAQMFGVQGYPTLKFFVNGEPQEYNGPREQAGIVQWLKKKTSPSTTELSDSEALEKAKTDNKVVIVFFGDDESEEFTTWQSVSKNFDFLFYHVFDNELAEANGVEGTGVALFKQFDEGRNDFEGEFTLDNVMSFVSTNSVETIMRFDQDVASFIFGQGQTALFLFTDLEGEDHDASYAALKEVAGEIKESGLLMSHSGIAEGMDQRLADYIGVTANHLPSVWIIDANQQDLKKFMMEGEVNAEGILSFVQQFQAGGVQQHVKSEEVPETQDEAVYVVVGKSWNDVVLDSTKDVLVEYYAPWCGHCKALAPIYEAVAQTLTDLGCDNIVIAKMDATANENENVQVSGFPTLEFYPSNNKQALDFDGDRTEEGFYKYLLDHVSSATTCDLGSLLEQEQEQVVLDEEDDTVKEDL